MFEKIDTELTGAEMRAGYYTERTPNIPELRKTVEWVEAQSQLLPSERDWNQSTWIYPRRSDDAQMSVCGTWRCFAGEVALRHGFPVASRAQLADGNIVPIKEFAAYHLGIDISQANQLFAASNGAAEIRRIAEEIAGEPL